MRDIEDLLTRRPQPRQRPNTRHILQGLVNQQPDAREHETGKRSRDAVVGHQGPDPSREDALTPVHGVVQDENVARRGEGCGGDVEEAGESVSGDVGVWAVGYELFELFAKGHDGYPDDSSADAVCEGGSQANAGC